MFNDEIYVDVGLFFLYVLEYAERFGDTWEKDFSYFLFPSPSIPHASVKSSEQTNLIVGIEVAEQVGWEHLTMKIGIVDIKIWFHKALFEKQRRLNI